MSQPPSRRRLLEAAAGGLLGMVLAGSALYFLPASLAVSALLALAGALSVGTLAWVLWKDHARGVRRGLT